jgi:hypothetical protein
MPILGVLFPALGLPKLTSVLVPMPEGIGRRSSVAFVQMPACVSIRSVLLSGNEPERTHRDNTGRAFARLSLALLPE